MRREEERAADAIERYLDAASNEALPRRNRLHAWSLAYIGGSFIEVKSARPA